MTERIKFDVFLSHNSLDKPRVRQLAEALKSEGLLVWFDEWVIKGGDDIYLSIERGLETSRALVLCMSAATFGSAWVDLERSTVLFRDPANKDRRFIPLLMTDCDIPDALRRYKYVDYREESDAAFKELLTLCRWEREPQSFGAQQTSLEKADSEKRSQPEPTTAVEGNLTSQKNTLASELEKLRYLQTEFVGREQELQLILDALRSTKPSRLVCIDGLGGVGKTALAEEVVRRALKEGIFSRLHWKTAKLEGLVGSNRIRLSTDPVAWGSIRTDFLRATEKHPEARFLFVLDNLETAEGLGDLLAEMPKVIGPHTAIVTSRERLHWHADIHSISIKGLTEEDSVLFLRSDSMARSIQAVATAPENDLKEIAKALEGSPLAMKLVVGLCEALSIESVLARLLKAKLDMQSAGGSLYTFIYLDAWHRLGELAKQLLIYVGKTTQDTLGELEVNAIFSEMGHDEDDIRSALAQLVHYCLLDPNSELRASKKRYGMHALTRAFVTTELPELWRKHNR
jgi:hypothetical protein